MRSTLRGGGLRIAFAIEVAELILPRRKMPGEGSATVMNRHRSGALALIVECREEARDFVGKDRGDGAFERLFFSSGEPGQGGDQLAGHVIGVPAIQQMIELL